MTHDELLEELDEIIKDFDAKYDNHNPYYKALRAVVELHKPITEEYLKGQCQADADGQYFYPYPCPTIQAIEKMVFNESNL